MAASSAPKRIRLMGRGIMRDFQRTVAKYPFEDIRTFVCQRSWFAPKYMKFEEGDYEKLKARKLHFTPTRAAYLRAFIDGYLAARG